MRSVSLSSRPSHGVVSVPAPEGPAPPKDEWTFAQALLNSDATSQQSVVALGEPIPIVVAKYRASDKSGGVWISPPAVRLGSDSAELQYQRFTTALVISEGEIGPIAENQIYRGGYEFTAFSGRELSQRYGSIPSWDYSYKMASRPVTVADTSVIWVVPSSVGTMTINNRSCNYFDYTVENTVDRTGSIHLFSNTNRPPDGSMTGDFIAYRYQQFVNGVQVFQWGTVSPVFCQWSFNEGLTFGANAPSAPSRLTIRIIQADTSSTCGTSTGVTNISKSWPAQPALRITLATVTKAGETVVKPATGSGGSFSGISTLSIKGSLPSNAPWGVFDHQAQVFVKEGIRLENISNSAVESSDNFADIAYYLLTRSAGITAALVDKDSMKTARQFMARYDLRFNGVMAVSVNLRDFLTQTALYYLLQLTQQNGKFGLKPLLPTLSNGSIDATRPVVPVKLFTADNIVGDTLQVTYVATEKRLPFAAIMAWRQQSPTSYSEEKITTVHYASEGGSGPFEKYDMSMFCMSQAHAAMAAKHILAARKHVSHSISFQTTELNVRLAPGDIVRVSQSWESSDGVYDKNQLYQVTSIAEEQAGTTAIEASYYPVTAGGASQVAYDVLYASFTIS